MKLFEKLEQMPAETKIKVGAKDGRSYFYIGTVGDLNERMDEVSDRIRKNLSLRKRSCKARITSMLENPPALSTWAKLELNKDDPKLNPGEFEHFVGTWMYSLKRAEILWRRLVARQTRFTPISEREVLEWELADTAVEDNVFRVILPGKEEGLYWSTDEAPSIPIVGLWYDEKEGEECDS